MGGTLESNVLDLSKKMYLTNSTAARVMVISCEGEREGREERGGRERWSRREREKSKRTETNVMLS